MCILILQLQMFQCYTKCLKYSNEKEKGGLNDSVKLLKIKWKVENQRIFFLLIWGIQF